jgi:hypothetical protein
MRCSGVAILAMTVAWAQSGCSLLLVNGPSSTNEVREFHPLEECTSTFGAPIVDVVTAAVIPPVVVLRGLAGENGDDQQTAEVVSISALVIAGVFLVSSVWGFYTVGKCRRYLERRR